MAAPKYGAKSFLKSFVNVPAWMGAGQLRRTADDISSLSRELFSLKRPPVREETFEAAVARFNLSEADLVRIQRNFGRLAAFYLFLAACLGLYALYLFCLSAALSGFMTLVLVLVTTSFAFKEHFWYVQMRQKRLGLSLKEWFLFTIGKTKAGHLTHE